jgi:hypothetical protein
MWPYHSVGMIQRIFHLTTTFSNKETYVITFFRCLVAHSYPASLTHPIFDDTIQESCASSTHPPPTESGSQPTAMKKESSCCTFYSTQKMPPLQPSSRSSTLCYSNHPAILLSPICSVKAETQSVLSRWLWPTIGRTTLITSYFPATLMPSLTALPPPSLQTYWQRMISSFCEPVPLPFLIISHLAWRAGPFLGHELDLTHMSKKIRYYFRCPPSLALPCKPLISHLLKKISTMSIH